MCLGLLRPTRPRIEGEPLRVVQGILTAKRADLDDCRRRTRGYLIISSSHDLMPGMPMPMMMSTLSTPRPYDLSSGVHRTCVTGRLSPEQRLRANNRGCDHLRHESCIPPRPHRA
jgi:hypothetical protein